MNIFIDRHHDGLFGSLIRLFEDRLGHKVYFPIGTDWFQQNYWLLAEPYGNDPGTVSQYLAIREKDPRAITLEQFKHMDIDVVVASYSPHIPVYADLIKKFKPKAKLIHQQGNEWNIDFSIVKNLLSSCKPYKIPKGVHAVWYHQEFPQEIYYYQSPSIMSVFMRSFVNTLGQQDMFHKDWEDFKDLELLLPNYVFESYGASTRDGVINDKETIADKMRESLFGIHLKTGGDGYGHTIHQWASVGRPLIYRSSQYKDRLAESLLVNTVTGFDLDHYPLGEVALMINKMSFDQYSRMCRAIHDEFQNSCDFDSEAEAIKTFLSNLK